MKRVFKFRLEVSADDCLNPRYDKLIQEHARKHLPDSRGYYDTGYFNDSGMALVDAKLINRYISLCEDLETVRTSDNPEGKDERILQLINQIDFMRRWLYEHGYSTEAVAAVDP